MLALTQQLIECWRRQNLEIAIGATREQIEQFEQTNQVYLPQSVRDYFLASNGMGRRGHQFDEDFFSLWSLDDLVPMDQEFESAGALTPEPDSYYMFADHSIGIIYYAMRLDSKADQRGRVIGFYPPYMEDAKVIIDFPTFPAFLEAYLQGPMANCM
jgi:hypothetical protein